MGRLEVQIRHGHDGGGSGAVIALILFIVLAAAGGAGHKALSGAVHNVLTVIEIALWALGGLVAAAAAVLGWRVRNAMRAARARRAEPPAVITVTPEAATARRLRPEGRPAIGPAGTARPWPLPGWWQEIRPRIGRDDHPGGAS